MNKHFAILKVAAAAAFTFPAPTICAIPSNGIITYEYAGEWGGKEPDAGFLDSIAAIAVTPDGTIYVADDAPAGDRIQVFTSFGEYLRTWGAIGKGPGELWSPTALGSVG